jgi:hypothetical protein
MALLGAKMDSLDRGVPFPVQDELVCERCREVHASLDIGADACGSLHVSTMRAPVRARIREMIRSSRVQKAPHEGTARTSKEKSRRRLHRSA